MTEQASKIDPIDTITDLDSAYRVFGEIMRLPERSTPSDHPYLVSRRLDSAALTHSSVVAMDDETRARAQERASELNTIYEAQPSDQELRKTERELFALIEKRTMGDVTAILSSVSSVSLVYKTVSMFLFRDALGAATVAGLKRLQELDLSGELSKSVQENYHISMSSQKVNKVSPVYQFIRNGDILGALDYFDRDVNHNSDRQLAENKKRAINNQVNALSHKFNSMAGFRGAALVEGLQEIRIRLKALKSQVEAPLLDFAQSRLADNVALRTRLSPPLALSLYKMLHIDPLLSQGDPLYAFEQFLQFEQLLLDDFSIKEWSELDTIIVAGPTRDSISDRIRRESKDISSKVFTGPEMIVALRDRIMTKFEEFGEFYPDAWKDYLSLAPLLIKLVSGNEMEYEEILSFRSLTRKLLGTRVAP